MNDVFDSGLVLLEGNKQLIDSLKFNFNIDKDTASVLMWLYDKLPSYEFSLFMKMNTKFENNIITVDIHSPRIPKQLVTTASVVYKEDNLKTEPVVIHKHPDGMTSFSGVDEEYINSNFDISLLLVKNYQRPIYSGYGAQHTNKNKNKNKSKNKSKSKTTNRYPYGSLYNNWNEWNADNWGADQWNDYWSNSQSNVSTSKSAKYPTIAKIKLRIKSSLTHELFNTKQDQIYFTYLLNPLIDTKNVTVNIDLTEDDYSNIEELGLKTINKLNLNVENILANTVVNKTYNNLNNKDIVKFRYSWA